MMSWTTSVDAAEQQPRPIVSKLGYRAFDFEILTYRPPRPFGGGPEPALIFAVTRKSPHYKLKVVWCEISEPKRGDIIGVICAVARRSSRRAQEPRRS